MKKINQEEYELLKGLENMWKWIAREEDRGLYAFTKKPVKKSGKISPSYWDTGAEWSHPVLELIDEIHLFQFIQWEDEEPYNISELIEEHEISLKYQESVELGEQVIRGHIKNQLKDESEETEVKKDIEWLGGKLESLKELDLEMWKQSEPNSKSQSHFNGSVATIDKVLDFLDQLDEPEVLSQEWIDEHRMMGIYKDSNGRLMSYFALEDLQNLLVPKQEELEVKIQDLIEIYKQEEGAYSNRENGWISGFVEDLKNLLEEEQKYRVIFPSVDEDGKGFNYLAKDCYHKELWVEDTRTDGLVREERSSFTENEIRDLDKGDILFEHFSVNVKELEE